MAKGKKSSAEKKAAGARRLERQRERNRERNAVRRASAEPPGTGADPAGFWRGMGSAEELTPALIDELVERYGWKRTDLDAFAAEGYRYRRDRNTLSGPVEFEGPMFER